MRVATEADHDPSESARWLDLVAAGNVVLTWHEDPVPILRDLDDRIETDATIGQLDAAAFMATAVDAAVTSYFKSVDQIEEVVDRLDTVALAGDPEHDVLADLVDIRRRISRLRRVLSSQREVFAAFGTPDFRTVVGDDAEAFAGVASRFENALQSVDNSRDLLLGSFDVFMTRTAQRTNDTMKILTLVTVLLLPGAADRRAPGHERRGAAEQGQPPELLDRGRRDRGAGERRARDRADAALDLAQRHLTPD